MWKRNQFVQWVEDWTVKHKGRVTTTGSQDKIFFSCLIVPVMAFDQFKMTYDRSINNKKKRRIN